MKDLELSTVMWQYEKNIIFFRVDQCLDFLNEGAGDYLISVGVPQVEHFFWVVDKHFISTIWLNKFDLARLIVWTIPWIKLSYDWTDFFNIDKPQASTRHLE